MKNSFVATSITLAIPFEAEEKETPYLACTLNFKKNQMKPRSYNNLVTLIILLKITILDHVVAVLEAFVFYKLIFLNHWIHII